MFSIFSPHAAVEELEGLEAQRTRVEFTDSKEFDCLTRESAKLLSQTLEKNQELTLFSLMRTRHYFFGMPNMVSELCGPGNTALGLVDAVVTSAFLDPEFEEFWRIGTEESCYDSKILEAIKKDFKDEFGGELTRGDLKKKKPLLDSAFQVYSIFAPRLSLGSIWEVLFNIEFFRGWEITGFLSANMGWITDGECRQEIFKRVGQDSCLPFKTTTSHGISDDSFVEVRYYFDPWVLEESAPFQISFRKKADSIPGSLKRFLYSPADAEKALRKAHSEVDILRRACLEESLPQKQRLYERAIEAGLQEPSLCYELGLSLEKTDKSRATSLFKSAADRGDPFSFTHYGLSLKEEGNLEEAKSYLKKGSELGSPHAFYHLARLVDKERALGYLRASADLGNGPAAYEHALRLYETVYKVLKESRHIPREATTFASRLPKPFYLSLS
jgi:tetratricopeptide (TPR) repeat protein